MVCVISAFCCTVVSWCLCVSVSARGSQWSEFCLIFHLDFHF